MKVAGEIYQTSELSAKEQLLLPEDPEVRSALLTVASIISLDAVQWHFSGEEAGENMSKIVRFKERYQPTNYPDEAWLQLIGRQGDNLLHGEYMRYLGNVILDSEPHHDSTNSLQDVEKFLFGFTNLTHDWGEANPRVGDVAFGNNKPNRDLERTTRSELAKQVLLEVCAGQGLDSRSVNRLDEALAWIVDWSDKIAFQKPDFSDLSTGGQISSQEYYQHLYRATKYAGHLAVPLRAGKLIDERPRLQDVNNSQSEVYHNIRRLHSEVSHNALPVVIEYAHIFPGINFFLQGRRDDIDKAMDYSLKLFPSTTTNYNDEYERPLSLQELNDQWTVYKKTL